jgi:uncharacterized protein (TIGR00255 family)
MKSMTCFGRGDAQDENYMVAIDIRGVNNRYKDINIHVPPVLRPLEMKLKQALAERFHRGRFDLTLDVKIIHSKQQRLRIDHDLAREIKEGMQKLKEDLQLLGDVSVDTLSRFKDLFQMEEEGLAESILPVVMEALKKVMVDVNTMKIEEGKAIRKDIEDRLKEISRLRKSVVRESETLVEEYRTRLQKKIKKILSDQVVDEYRLEQEVSYLAERSDIAEELVRLESHLNQFHDTLDQDGAIGRKLDFILQEMNREVNTIAAKSSNSAISSTTIEMKSEIEKIREQIQNVE